MGARRVEDAAAPVKALDPAMPDARDRLVLRPQPLEATAFAPYGELIEAGPARPRRLINAGHADRFDALARIDADAGGACPMVSIFRARPWALPLRLEAVERHRLGSQLFMPLGPQRYLVVVAAADAEPTAGTLRCFAAGPGQGVNLARGTWHHPLLALEAGDFLVIERGGPGIAQDCELRRIDAARLWIERDDTTQGGSRA